MFALIKFNNYATVSSTAENFEVNAAEWKVVRLM